MTPWEIFQWRVFPDNLPIAGDKLSHSPHVGEHNQEVLTELGYSTTDIENFKMKVLLVRLHPKFKIFN